MKVGKMFLVVTAVACLSSPAVALAGGLGATPTPEPVSCRCPVGDFWFSTEVEFTSGAFPHMIFRVSDGDLLWERRPWRITNNTLTRNLGIMPVVPDLGLDAVTFPYRDNVTTPTLTAEGPLTHARCRDIWFSLEESIWSETLGRLNHGDLLSTRGRIVRTNWQLIDAFGPVVMSVDGVGLDAVHFRPVLSAVEPSDITPVERRGIYFSTETNFWSGALQRLIRHGDLLNENGTVYRTNAQLLRNFHPCLTAVSIDDVEPAVRDYGLDAVYVMRNGRVLFSLERDFCDRYWGWIDEGDLLCECGCVVRRNRQLMDVWQPLEDLDDFGLDAIELMPRKIMPFPIDDIEVEPAEPTEIGG